MIKIVILAAGMGKRMQSSSTPKVLQEVALRSILEHILLAVEAIESPKVTHLVLSDEVIQHPVFQELQQRYKFEYSIQTERLGTAHALLHALDGGTQQNTKCSHVLVLCGDAPLIRTETLNMLLDAHLESEASLSLLCFEAENPHGYGRVFTNGSNISFIVEQKDLSSEQEANKLCNSGIMVIKNAALVNDLKSITPNEKTNEYYLTDIVAQYCNANKLCIYYNVPEWEVHGINTNTHLVKAEYLMQKRIVESLQASGVKVMQAETSYFGADFTAGHGVTIFPNVFIGKGVKVGNNSTIHSFSWLSECVIGEDNVIGPFARIRPDSKTEPSVRIGNFVEIKAVKIGTGTKISHLSYVGDATLGQGVNIGAGTIFCNYDGIQKHYSIVEDDVFIGSNSAIVSPITLGKGSIVAAGSVVTEDCPEDSLVIARAKQNNLAGKAKLLR